VIEMLCSSLNLLKQSISITACATALELIVI